MGSYHLQRWLVLQLAYQGLVRFPLLSAWVHPEQLLGPSKGEALYKVKFKIA